MARPSKWASKTVAIRVPERFAADLLEQAKKLEEGSGGFVQNSDDEFLGDLVEKALKRCEAEGVDPKELLLWLKLRDLQDFLSHYPKQKQWQFIVRLMDSTPSD